MGGKAGKGGYKKAKALDIDAAGTHPGDLAEAAARFVSGVSRLSASDAGDSEIASVRADIQRIMLRASSNSRPDAGCIEHIVQEAHRLQARHIELTGARDGLAALMLSGDVAKKLGLGSKLED